MTLTGVLPLVLLAAWLASCGKSNEPSLSERTARDFDAARGRRVPGARPASGFGAGRPGVPSTPGGDPAFAPNATAARATARTWGQTQAALGRQFDAALEALWTGDDPERARLLIEQFTEATQDWPVWRTAAQQCRAYLASEVAAQQRLAEAETQLEAGEDDAARQTLARLRAEYPLDLRRVSRVFTERLPALLRRLDGGGTDTPTPQTPATIDRQVRLFKQFENAANDRERITALVALLREAPAGPYAVRAMRLLDALFVPRLEAARNQPTNAGRQAAYSGLLRQFPLTNFRRAIIEARRRENETPADARGLAAAVARARTAYVGAIEALQVLLPADDVRRDYLRTLVRHLAGTRTRLGDPPRPDLYARAARWLYDAGRYQGAFMLLSRQFELAGDAAERRVATAMRERQRSRFLASIRAGKLAPSAGAWAAWKLTGLNRISPDKTSPDVFEVAGRSATAVFTDGTLAGGEYAWEFEGAGAFRYVFFFKSKTTRGGVTVEINDLRSSVRGATNVLSCRVRVATQPSATRATEWVRVPAKRTQSLKVQITRNLVRVRLNAKTLMSESISTPYFAALSGPFGFEVSGPRARLTVAKVTLDVPGSATGAGNGAPGDDPPITGFAPATPEVAAALAALAEARQALIGALNDQRAPLAEDHAARPAIEAMLADLARSSLARPAAQPFDQLASRLLRHGYVLDAARLGKACETPEARTALKQAAAPIDLLARGAPWRVESPVTNTPERFFATARGSLTLRQACRVWVATPRLYDFEATVTFTVIQGSRFAWHFKRRRGGGLSSRLAGLRVQLAPDNGKSWRRLAVAATEFTSVSSGGRFRRFSTRAQREAGATEPPAPLARSPLTFRVRLVGSALTAWRGREREPYFQSGVQPAYREASGFGFTLTADPEGAAQAKVTALTVTPLRRAVESGAGR